jgi:hypothetical protein
MTAITWKYSDLTGRSFGFETENQLVGNLTLRGESSASANFIAANTNIQQRRVSLWKNNLLQRKK